MPPTRRHTPRSPRCPGFSILEILVAVTVVAILIGLLLPALGMVRERSRVAVAAATVSGLHNAFEAYRNEDPRNRYPTPMPDGLIHRALVEHLEDHGLWARGNRPVEGGVLVDPWERPYRYALQRPSPPAGDATLQRWNWNAEDGHEARWGERRDPATGNVVTGALPYPYLWSLGPDGDADDASDWIVVEGGA